MRFQVCCCCEAQRIQSGWTIKWNGTVPGITWDVSAIRSWYQSLHPAKVPGVLVDSDKLNRGAVGLRTNKIPLLIEAPGATSSSRKCIREILLLRNAACYLDTANCFDCTSQRAESAHAGSAHASTTIVLVESTRRPRVLSCCLQPFETLSRNAAHRYLFGRRR